MFCGQIVGFLIKDAKVTVLDTGSKLVSFAVSIRSENPKMRDAKPPVRDLVSVTTFINQNSKMDASLKSGLTVGINGKIYVEEYNGKTYVKMEAQSNAIEFVTTGPREKTDGAPQGAENHQEQQAPTNTGDGSGWPG